MPTEHAIFLMWYLDVCVNPEEEKRRDFGQQRSQGRTTNAHLGQSRITEDQSPVEEDVDHGHDERRIGDDARAADADICEYAIQNYTNNFDHKIQQLLQSFPPDYKNKDGSDFWTGSKRLPHPIHFDTNIDLCLNYVIKFAQILSHALGIGLTKEQLSKENIEKICSKIKVPEYIKNEKKINLEEESKTADNNIKNPEQTNFDNQLDSEEQKKAQKEINEILAELDKIKREDFDPNKINPEDFEKDHDENGHIDFIHAGANLRARNYNIDECDRNKTKKIAGKIIPTILTTTASIAGIVSLQFYAMFQTNENEFFRDCFFNLSSNYFYFSKPAEPIKMKDNEFDSKIMGPVKAIPEGWNVWDRIEINESKTCGQLIEELKTKYDIDVDMLVANGETIITTFLESAKKKMGLKIEEAYGQNSQKKDTQNKNYLNIQVIGVIKEAKIGEKTLKNVSAFIPPIKYIYK